MSNIWQVFQLQLMQLKAVLSKARPSGRWAVQVELTQARRRYLFEGDAALQKLNQYGIHLVPQGLGLGLATQQTEFEMDAWSGLVKTVLIDPGLCQRSQWKDIRFQFSSNLLYTIRYRNISARVFPFFWQETSDRSLISIIYRRLVLELSSVNLRLSLALYGFFAAFFAIVLHYSSWLESEGRRRDLAAGETQSLESAEIAFSDDTGFNGHNVFSESVKGAQTSTERLQSLIRNLSHSPTSKIKLVVSGSTLVSFGKGTNPARETGNSNRGVLDQIAKTKIEVPSQGQKLSKVSGLEDVDKLESEFAKIKPQLRRCYEAELLKTHTETLSLHVEGQIDLEGNFRQIRTRLSSGQNSNVQDCVGQEIAKLRAPNKVSGMKINKDFIFRM